MTTHFFRTPADNSARLAWIPCRNSQLGAEQASRCSRIASSHCGSSEFQVPAVL